MHLAHPLEHFLIIRVACQVPDLVRVALRIVKLLNRLGRLKILHLRSLELALRVEPAHLLHRRHPVHILDVLTARNIRHIVANIFITLVTYRTNKVVCLIHTVTCSENILTRPCLLTAEKRLTLYVGRYLHAGQRKHCRRKINERNQLVVDLAGFDRIGLLGHRRFSQPLRHPNDQRNVNARIINPSFAPRQPATMVSPEPHNRILRQPVLL